jgi:nucleotide-binding universal stress UspA family protein
MFRILFATDGSDHAAAAGRVLEAWSLTGRADVTVVTVVPPIPLFSSALIGPASAGWAAVPEIAEHEAEAAQRIAATAAARLRGPTEAQAGPSPSSGGDSGGAVECAVRHGAAAEEILKAVDELRADLVVLGSHGQSGLAHLLIGSVSQNVARHAPCSALVVREREASRGGVRTRTPGSAAGRWLLAVDGSSASEAAARLAASLPLPPGQSCLVLHVLQPNLEPGDPRGSQRTAAAQHLIEKTAAALTEAGYQASTQVREGHPAQEIVRAAQEFEADVIVVGAQGLSGLQEFLLGSVSARVLRYAPCSVLVAR